MQVTRKGSDQTAHISPNWKYHVAAQYKVYSLSCIAKLCVVVVLFSINNSNKEYMCCQLCKTATQNRK